MKARMWVRDWLKRRFRTTLLGKAKFTVVPGFLLMTLLVQATPVAWADSPASTDFGQVDATPTLSTAHTGEWKQALFLTLYPDGHSQSEVHVVRDDAENTLLGEHPTWQLDRSLTWFVQMPVYVRKLSNDQASAGTSAV